MELCKRYAAFRTVRGVVTSEDTRRKLCVSYKGLTAYPLGYRLEYTATPNKAQVFGGEPVTAHYAVLRLTDALTELTVPLETVEKQED